jgi:hypothetical protein
VRSAEHRANVGGLEGVPHPDDAGTYRFCAQRRSTAGALPHLVLRQGWCRIEGIFRGHAWVPCERVLDACLGRRTARRSPNGVEWGQFGGRAGERETVRAGQRVRLCLFQFSVPLLLCSVNDRTNMLIIAFLSVLLLVPISLLCYHMNNKIL